jgi:hypothetical protein
VLANMATTFDQLSRGCLELALGAETAAQASAFVAAGARHICPYFEDNTRPGALGPTAEAVIAAV